jgi:hypothetical protein
MDPRYNFVYRIAASLEDELTEVDAGWFDKLSDAAKETYLRLHPQSKYAKYVRRQTRQAPTDIEKIAPTKEALKGMRKHLKELEYGAENEKDAKRRNAFKDEYNKLGMMIRRQEERIDDEYYQGKERAKQERKQQKDVQKEERQKTDPRKWWEKAIGRENPAGPRRPPAAGPGDKGPSPAPGAGPRKQAAEPAPGKEPRTSEQLEQQQPQKRKYSREELERLHKGGGMASDYVPDSAMPKPGHGPKPTSVVKKRKPSKLTNEE